MTNQHSRSEVKILTPEEAHAGIHLTFAYNWPNMEKHPGVLFDYGPVTGSFMLGGYSTDKRVFVLVPERIVNAWIDDWLRASAITHVGTAEEHIADFIAGVKGANPEDYSDWRGDCYRDADIHARLVAYWLGGTEDHPPPGAPPAWQA